MSSNRYFAVLSGVCASAASLFGKLAGLSSLENMFLIRVLCFVSMLVSNMCVWTFYVKALQAASSSLTTTVISAATNYLLSALAGFFIFGEVTSLLWWTGAGLIVIGILVIVSDQIKSHDYALMEARDDAKISTNH